MAAVGQCLKSRGLARPKPSGCPVQASLGRGCSVVTENFRHWQLSLSRALGTKTLSAIRTVAFLDLQLLSTWGLSQAFANDDPGALPFSRSVREGGALAAFPERNIRGLWVPLARVFVEVGEPDF